MNNDWREYYDPQYVLMHHGIRGQKWGVRRYEKESGGLTAAGKARYNTIDGKYQKVKAAKAKANESYMAYNKDFNKAFRASQRINITKKRKAERDALIDKAYESGKKADKDIADFKKAKTDLKFTKKIAKNDAERDRILEKRAQNREKLENKKSIKEKIYDVNAKVYDKLGNKALASANKAAATAEHKKNSEAMKAKLKDFDAGTKAVKAGYDRYSKTLRDYGNAKMSAIGNKDAKKTESYKSAAKAYRKQVGSDLFYGRSGTTLNYAVDAASKKR